MTKKIASSRQKHPSCHPLFVVIFVLFFMDIFINTELRAQSTPPSDTSQNSALRIGPVSNYLKAESTYDTSAGKFISNLIGFGQDFEGSIQKKNREFPWKIRYRFWLDREKLSPPYNPSYRMIERILAQIAASFGSTRVSIGMQEVTWGENLIMPILDVVNPRDITHPYGYYDSQSKIPQPLLVIDQPWEEHRLEFIFNPYPFPMKYPDEVAGRRVKTEKRPPPSSEYWEYGSRLVLVHDAFETKFYYYHHGIRTPTFLFLPYSSGDTDRPDIQATSFMSDTFGSSISFATFQWLLRGDLALHNRNPSTNISTQVETTTTTQAILGLSTTTLAQQTIGAEFHFERWEKAPLAYQQQAIVEEKPDPSQFTWLGLIANLNFLNSKINPNLVYFHGLDSEDSLLKTDLRFTLDSQSTLALEWLSTSVKTKSPKLLLGARNSISTKFSYIF